MRHLKLCEVGESSKMNYGGRKGSGASLCETEVPRTCWLTGLRANVCTFSSLHTCMSLTNSGLHTGAAYSKCGLTMVV